MSDLINRQAAIDALRKLSREDGYIDMPHEYVTDAVRALPSAQPLVLHCTDCEDWHTKQGVWGISISELPSTQPEQDMVDDLISFIEREKDKENRTLADWTVQWILESIIDGECKITGSATDHKEKKMYVEFSFYQEEHDG